VTARESAEGETIDERLRQEEPELWEQAEAERDADVVDGPVGGEVGSSRAGRLLAPVEGTHEDTDGPVAEDEGIDGGAASAEEAAVHVIDADE
jgi:hypothetical protein